ncbi:MAG: PAS domain S-box protein [Gammaproteobacteria bacterium]
MLIARQSAERALQEANQRLEQQAAELREQREWFAVTLSSIGDAVITTDTAGLVTFLNPVAETMTGWRLTEARGQALADIFRIVNELTGQVAENPVAKALLTGEIVALANHTALIRRDGTTVAIEDSAAPIRDAKGKISGVVMVFHDVSVRRAAEMALRDTRARLDATLGAAEIGTWTWDIQKNRVIADRNLAHMFGVTPEIAAGAPMEAFIGAIHPDDRQRVEATVKAALESSPGRYEAEYRLNRADGSFRWIVARGKTQFDEAGVPTHLPGVALDITERKQAEELRSRLAAVVESSDDAILSKNLDGIIITWNRGAERMFGYSPIEVIGRPVTVLIPPEHINEEPDILRRLRRGERIDHYETVRVRKDGTRIAVSLTVSPIRDGNGTVIGASKIARDITEKQHAEAIQRELYESAQREIKQRESAEAALREVDRRKDEFLATLAHELRNPLAPIRQAALISKAVAATEDQKRWSHDVINRQVHHMALLLDDLLDISRVTRGILELRLEMTDLGSIIETAIETARPLIEGKRHSLTVELPKEPIRFAADPLRLSQVLSNLLTNAAKYTDPQGQIRLGASDTADTITIRVSDNGIGIPRDALEEVFAMFSQVKSAQDRSEGGLGIGLAFTKGPGRAAPRDDRGPECRHRAWQRVHRETSTPGAECHPD